MATVNGLVGGLGVAFKERGRRLLRGVEVRSATTGPAGVVSCTISFDLPKSHSLSAHPHPGQSDWVVPQPPEQDVLVIEPAPSRLADGGAELSPNRRHDPREGQGDADHGQRGHPRRVGVDVVRWDGGPEAAGEATVTMSISSQGGAGARTVKVWFSGDPDLYEKSEATFTLQVSPSVS